MFICGNRALTLRACLKLSKTPFFITRSLHIPYLWIDSICIVQDDPEDWRRESVLMEDVFSSAYCTTSARVKPGSALLKSPRNRKVVGLKPHGYTSVFICEPIDDFQRDVEEDPLSNRGWVFQERVLSRRTICFTENQAYWECGEGVRCETLTRMKKYVKKSCILETNHVLTSIAASKWHF